VSHCSTPHIATDTATDWDSAATNQSATATIDSVTRLKYSEHGCQQRLNHHIPQNHVGLLHLLVANVQTIGILFKTTNCQCFWHIRGRRHRASSKGAKPFRAVDLKVNDEQLSVNLPVLCTQKHIQEPSGYQQISGARLRQSGPSGAAVIVCRNDVPHLGCS
jgi:hypothetical protein